MGKGAQLAIGAVLVCALLGWYGYTNLEGAASFRYYQTLAEFRDAQIAPGTSLRVHGYVANGSDRSRPARRAAACYFRVQNEPPHAGGAVGVTLPVVYQSLETPDLFKDGAEVVVEGTLSGSGDGAVFVADNVMAKCPSKFEAEVGGGAPTAEL